MVAPLAIPALRTICWRPTCARPVSIVKQNSKAWGPSLVACLARSRLWGQTSAQKQNQFQAQLTITKKNFLIVWTPPLYALFTHIILPNVVRLEPALAPQPDMLAWVEEDQSYSDSITQDRHCGLSPRVLESSRITDIHSKWWLASYLVPDLPPLACRTCFTSLFIKFSSP